MFDILIFFSESKRLEIEQLDNLFSNSSLDFLDNQIDYNNQDLEDQPHVNHSVSQFSQKPSSQFNNHQSSQTTLTQNFNDFLFLNVDQIDDNLKNDIKNENLVNKFPLFFLPESITSETNWQASITNLRKRNSALFNNEYMSDITFLVGSDLKYENTDDLLLNSCKTNCNKIIPAHKHVLAIGSSVFHAMFYGSLSEKQSIIKLPDVDPQAFLILLKYLYCDEIFLSFDYVLPTFYVSKKYIVPYLCKACIDFMKSLLNGQNVIFLFSQMRLFDEPEFNKQCLEVIDSQSQLAFQSKYFLDLERETLKLILERDTLNTKEIVIFDTCLLWAEKECERQNLEVNNINKRKILGELLFLIRIPTMSLLEFANGPALSGILTHEEANIFFLYFTVKSDTLNKFIKKFNLNKRKGLESLICQKFNSYQTRYKE